MQTLGMIGGGVMGEALLSRLVQQGILPPESIWVSDPQAARRNLLQQQYGVQVTADNAEVAARADVLLLAIKPQMFEAVTSTLPPVQGSVISILAGTSIAQLEAAFLDRPVIRVMPNTPATVGAGMTAIAPGKYAQAEEIAEAKLIFTAVGEVVEVPEVWMDAVTGLSGSGPGYVAILIEALSDGGVAVGLPRAVALQLALQTVRGTAELLQTTGLHPAELKDRVTSPGGTTIAGIAQLEAGGFRSAIIKAVRAAADRSRQLSE